MKRLIQGCMAALLGILSVSAGYAGVPWDFGDNTRYMVMGDSLGAGYGAIPQTQGYAYLLYSQGAFDKASNTLLTSTAVIAATTGDVAAYQVPLAGVFGPDVITLTAGGNDLEPLFGLPPAEIPDAAQAIIYQLAMNLGATLGNLCAMTPAEPLRVYVGNLYSLPIDEELGLPAGTVDYLVQQINQAIAGTVSAVQGAFPPEVCELAVADIYSAFYGKTGLLLIERVKADAFEIHPTNRGHRAIADAFEAAIQ